MTQNAVFLDCSSKVPTLKGVGWLHSATSGAKNPSRGKKNSDVGGDEKLIIKFIWP